MPPGPDDLDRALSSARKALRGLRAGPPPDAEPLRGVGTAADGLIRVVAEGNRLSTLDIGPRAMRLSSEELAAQIRQAVNAALADLANAAAGADPAVDPVALDAQLAALQDQGMRAMALYTQAISDVMARFGRSG